MATDIWIHIEYKSRKKSRWAYAYEADGERNYSMFGILAGTRGDGDALYDPRGLPKDVSPETLKAYKDFEEDAHTPSWLTTQELKECMDQVLKKTKLMYVQQVKKSLQPYYKIYETMKYFEDQGEPCRMVFWFDN